MRFYPFGSSSLNPIFTVSAAATASLAQYARSSSYGFTIRSASQADTGLPGRTGTNGVCTYAVGAKGQKGLTGLTGVIGSVSVPQPYYPPEE